MRAGHLLWQGLPRLWQGLLTLPLFVEERGDAFDGPAIVGEDDGGAMFADEITEQPIDGRPHRFLRQRSEHLDGIDDVQIEILAQSRIDDGDRPRRELTVFVEIAA